MDAMALHRELEVEPLALLPLVLPRREQVRTKEPNARTLFESLSISLLHGGLSRLIAPRMHACMHACVFFHPSTSDHLSLSLSADPVGLLMHAFPSIHPPIHQLIHPSLHFRSSQATWASTDAAVRSKSVSQPGTPAPGCVVL